MYLKLIILLWLFCVPALAENEDPPLESLFILKKNAEGENTDEAGGCASRLSILNEFLLEARALVESGLQAISDAGNPSAAENAVAKRYLSAHFAVQDDDEVAMNKVAATLNTVQKFLNGQEDEEQETPRLYCDDTWLRKLTRATVAWDEDKNELIKLDEDGNEVYVAIEDVEVYRGWLWTRRKNGSWARNAMIPYWSDDLKEYVFDGTYDGNTFCTHPDKYLGATQDQTIPSTITLCPESFTNPNAVDGLGSKDPEAGLSITAILPKSATFYHELFHLALGPAETPDLTYSWVTQQQRLKKPDGRDAGSETNAERVRRNPESYVFFSVGYWYFQQTKWKDAKENERWSFHSGAAELVEI